MKAILLACLALFLALQLPALTGYGDTPAFTLDTVAPILDLIAPNGGEEWYIGDTHDILWTAADTNPASTGTYLWYSLNGGADYTVLAEAIANTGSYPWVMPASQSYNARVRVRVYDSFGNQSQDASATAFAITYVPPAAPQNVNMVITNSIDALITWDPVNQTIYGTPIVPDGYIVLYNETPYEDEQFYYFLGRSYTTNYTHHDVAEFRGQMYYRVKAYKYYTRGELELLDTLVQSTGKPLLWRDAQKMLQLGGGK